MLFNSLPFLFAFLPAVLMGFHLLGRLGKNAAIGWLAAASLVFYAYWNKDLLLLLLGSIVLNFLCGQMIARLTNRAEWQRAVLWVGIAGNLALLCYYKYWFPLLNSLGSLTHPQHYFGNVILPLGISFFTLTQIGYLVDLQQGQASVLNLLDHLFFVSFFPHLIAGPILHHREFMPQVTKTRIYRLAWNDVAVGSTWFVIGLFKKVVIADQIASHADLLFATPEGQPLLKVWCGVLSYAVQLYFDFSGYSDMAIGLARIFSLRFPLNFNSPYKAKSIIEFWQRWHMTLTNYLMLYIYNPLALAINRSRLAAGRPIGRKAVLSAEGFLRIIGVPTLVTMVIAGIWHGAGRQFLAFGMLHGIFICINHAWRTFAPKWSAFLGSNLFGRTGSVLVTFLAVVSAQIFFRADSIEGAFAIVRGAVGANGVGPIPHSGPNLFPWLALAFLFTVIWLFPNTQEILGQFSAGPGLETTQFPSMRFLQWQPTWSWSLLIGAAYFVSFVLMKTASRFLYFQF
jgi:D-alanyl-lipoteichoic acid acyltransferase DltB (MBOAT superfamily)